MVGRGLSLSVKGVGVSRLSLGEEEKERLGAFTTH